MKLINVKHKFKHFIFNDGKMKGQASVVDALFFLMVCSSAASLMIYTSGLYGANNSRQMAMVYNFEYASNALVALHYTEDLSGNFFWNQLKEKLATGGTSDVNAYLNTGDGREIWDDLIDSSPSGKTVLVFKKGGKVYCIDELGDVKCINEIAFDVENYPKTVFSSSVKLVDSNLQEWTVTLQLRY